MSSPEQDNAQASEATGEPPVEQETDAEIAVAQSEAEKPTLEMVLDVPVTLSLEIGNTRMPIRNLLQLNQGSVVELERAAGEPLDVRVNGVLVAHGEVVLLDEKFAIRLTDIVSPTERIRKLS
ncbi:MAG: flagellar motor switch protein FliN [Steroidobacteraceae bacterium]